ncbi:TPA: DNA polymerase II, partial [Candidatus Bathyarchaeota archaeon]|nr:DNA polymerase II [Candidatus Bathyarchaeota archaeon]
AVLPCNWHEVEVKEIERHNKEAVDKVYKALRPPNALERKDIPKLRILSFDLICYSKRGSPKPSRDPVALISVCCNSKEKKQFCAFNMKDKALIEGFLSFINEFDPDLIVGFNNNDFGWPYLIERGRVNGVKVVISRARSEPHRSVYGHISITGRANLDLLDFIKEIPEIKVETLDGLADFLGIGVKERTLVEGFEIPKFFEDDGKRQVLAKFSLENAELTLRSCESLLGFLTQLSSVTGLPLDQVISAAVGFRVDSYLIRQAHAFGELIPKRREQPYQHYRGAVVLAPKPGLHENAAVLDFASMYPNLMMIHNISPDTLLPSSEEHLKEEIVEIPEVGHKFKKYPPGFYKVVFSNLLAERKKIKEQLSKLNPESTEYKVLKEREKAVKIITNACYGYAGWVGARWYSREVAESATALGRRALKELINAAKRLGLKVIYSDTDSVFVEYEPGKIRKLQEAVLRSVGVEIKVDKLYDRVVFTEAKKKYAGLTKDGKLDVVGMEVVRGDWANIAKLAQLEVLKIILKEKSLEKALDYAKKLLRKLREEGAELKDFVVWKAITKPIDAYEVRAPHVEAAKKLIQEGWDLSAGDKIGYVIVKGSGRVYERAMPYELASLNKIDVEYYIHHQVIPALSRVLKVFGIDEARLDELSRSSSLMDFSH